MSFTWNRAPAEWGFKGLVRLHEIQNLDSLTQSGALAKFPEVGLYLPLLTEVSTLEFSGQLPSGSEGPTTWSLKFIDAASQEFGIDFTVDPSKDPWWVSFSLAPLSIPPDTLISYAPESLHPLLEGATLRLESLSAEGSWGEWGSWKTAARIDLDQKQASLYQWNQTLSGFSAKIGLEGRGTDWGGTADIAIEEFNTPQLPESLKGVKGNGLKVKYALPSNAFSVSGPWSVADGPGGSFEGTLSLSSEEGMKIEGQTRRLDLSEWEVDRFGDWSAAFALSSDRIGGPADSLLVDLRGENVRYGSLDLSKRPLEIRLRGKPPEEGPVSFDAFDIKWGDAFDISMPGSEWGGDVFEARNIVLSGNLLVLREFLPGFEPNSRYSQWVDPNKWRIRGGVRMVFQPHFTLETRETVLDTGKGQGGPFSLSFDGSSGAWKFSSPTLNFTLTDVEKELGMPGVLVSGNVSLQATLAGSLSAGGSEGWLSTAVVRGDISNSDGIWTRVNPDGSRGDSLVGWRGLQGAVRIDWSRASRKFDTDLRFRDWFWFTRPPHSDSEFPTTLSVNGVRLKLIVTKDDDRTFTLRECRFLQGEDTPIETSVSGTITQLGDGYVPDLQVRIEGNRAQKTPVFRGFHLAGTGVFIGTVKGNESGNWVLNGDAACSDIDLEFAIGPFIAENIRGDFFIRDVRLDELVRTSRWALRKHTLPESPSRPNSLEAAFQQAGSTPHNLFIERVEVGSSVYTDLSLRILLIKESLLLNTVEGSFDRGGYPLQMTGFLFFQPGYGSGWRIRGSTKRIPLHVAVPGLSAVRLDYEAVEADFYLTKGLQSLPVQTRYLSLSIPIGRLKEIPAVGNLLFGWTPDSLQTTELIVRREGNGPWEVLNPLDPTDIDQIPEFIFFKLPGGIRSQVQKRGTQFFEGVEDALRDFIQP